MCVLISYIYIPGIAKTSGMKSRHRWESVRHVCGMYSKLPVFTPDLFWVGRIPQDTNKHQPLIYYLSDGPSLQQLYSSSEEAQPSSPMASEQARVSVVLPEQHLQHELHLELIFSYLKCTSSLGKIHLLMSSSP